MSQYPNGHPSAPSAPGRYDEYRSHHNPTQPPQSQRQPRRVPSYCAGDDSQQYFNSHNETAVQGNGQYAVQSGPGYVGSVGQGSYNAHGVYDDEIDSRYSRTSSENTSLMSPTRATSQTSTMSNYQHQYSSGPPTGQPSYNPQQYALPQTQAQHSLGYNPMAYTNPISTPVSTHQPYNPAAYQPTAAPDMGASSIARRPSAASPYGQPPPTPQTYGYSSQPPPVPPRGADHPYGSRPSTYGLSTSSQPPATTIPVTYQSASSPNAPTYFPASSPLGVDVPAPSSRPYHSSSQGSGYASHGLNASYDDRPPEPPMHQTHTNGLYSRPSVSGRTLPDLPVQSGPSPVPPRRTDTLTRHPQARPLPGPPPDADSDGEDFASFRYEELMKEVEAAVMDPQGSFARRHSSRTSHGSDVRLAPDEQHTHTNGSVATGTGHEINYGAYSDESDAEAEAGLAMLRMAEEEDKAREERILQRRATNASILSSGGSYMSNRGPSPHSDPNEDSDYVAQDLALYEGGYAGNMHYGEDNTFSPEEHIDTAFGDRLNARSGSLRSTNLSPDERAGYLDDYEHPRIAYDYAQRLHHLPPDARVDAGGTGGLSAPNAFSRRMSFDYGEEGDSPYEQHHDADLSGDEGSYGPAHEDLFFHPGMRPLPPAPVEPSNTDLVSHLMPAGTYRPPETGDLHIYTQYRDPPISAGSSGETITSPSQVPRSSSMSTPIGPRADAPIRSKTDADRIKYKQQQAFLQHLQNKDLPKIGPSEAAAAITLDLPAIPSVRRKRFNPAKLSSEQFKKCTEPWALSSILSWIQDLSKDETDLKEQAITDAIVALFTHKVPTMNIADAETLAARVTRTMLREEALVKEEEWVKFGSGGLSGVLFQITGTGCYSSKLHDQEMHIQDTDSFGRCYAHHCMRTLKKVNLKAQMMAPQKKVEDWVTFYKVSKEALESHSKKEIDRQNNLHEIVTTEDAYIGQLDVLRELYRDQLGNMSPSIIPAKRLSKFLDDVFGKVDSVKKVNEDFLLAQLKYRQKEQGPFIVGFSDIFREWIRKAKNAYIDYAATFPTANYLVRKEAERNVNFKQFLNQVREHKLSGRLSWDTFLKAPITRIQRYTLLLATVHKNMPKDSEEKTNLAQAIEEIKVVALECDNKVGEMNKKADLMELAAKLQLRPEMQKEVELNLEHLGRQIIYRGDLQRPGTRTRFLVDTHAILFDHYLVLAKSFSTRDSARTAKYERYDVSKLPVPMDLLVLESTNDDPVVKSSVRGVSTVTPSQGVVAPMGQAGNGVSPGAPSSGKTLVPTTSLESSKDDKILYPFKIKHLGKNGTYTLYAFSAQSRKDWCERIIEAKTKHAAALFSQNAEPFRLRVLADTAFAYSDASAGSKSVTIKGTPLYRAIQEVEKRYESSKSRPPPVCRTAVNCATVFQQPPGRIMYGVGTDNGVYLAEHNNPRGWYRAIPIMRVTQIAVFEEFNLFLLIADRSLIAYHLDVVCPVSGTPSQSQDSARRAPQKLSGNREVGFFAAGRMNDRYLVLYKKRDGLSSTFKVLEPILQKSSSNKSKLFQSRRSQTEFFREYDEFYIPAESYHINMFHSSLAISTHRGIEVLTLDKKQSWSVPDFRSETPDAHDTLHGIANRIKDLRPLGMFRLSDSEFLVAYQECAVYVNKHGDVSRSVVMEFVGSAHSACLYGKFLILFNDDFVEVRNAMNGRLRQVIAGHSVTCLDDGSKLPGSLANHVQASQALASPGSAISLASGLSANGVFGGLPGHTVKICMQHPQYERSQIVLELVENEGQKD
ncbi:hypothetical protein N7474_001903 [Penicillium riverlandense]|uniref:uncharacterized protein n=1 Tax=Penicillium riverlandense TaxID=1903569 RepID=UPI0025485B47|nr:uncharacterized protein N7474_001903 [Penicillium riverlandense]KAJ5833592.1 hypothetical protein N7474_001903 [Penicillium riverlandense]